MIEADLEKEKEKSRPFQKKTSLQIKYNSNKSLESPPKKTGLQHFEKAYKPLSKGSGEKAKEA